MSNPYDQNPYSSGPGGQVPQPHPKGTTVLILGIVGLVVCPIVAIFGLIQGNSALKEIDANPAAYGNRQNVVIGRILSIIGLVLWGVGIIIYIIAIVVLAGSGALTR